jgi:hypothetical protein
MVLMASSMVPASFSVGITTETISTFDVISYHPLFLRAILFPIHG